MNEYDEVIAAMSRARDRRQLLEDDLVIAHYKGYGVSGGTYDEIVEELGGLDQQLVRMQERLDLLDT